MIDSALISKVSGFIASWAGGKVMEKAMKYIWTTLKVLFVYIIWIPRLLWLLLLILLWLLRLECHWSGWPSTLPAACSVDMDITEVKDRLTGQEREIADIRKDISQLKSEVPKIVGSRGERTDEPIKTEQDLVDEKELRAYLTEQMECGVKRLRLSDFIRFGPVKHSLQEKEREKIKRFVREHLKSADKGKLSDYVGVFGFASPDGPEPVNQNLSEQRAAAVRNVLNDDFGIDVPDNNAHLGERHFINGVANSRSAVIAVCQSDEQTETAQ